MAEVEKEAKLVVSREDYQRLRTRSRVLECRNQLNVYLHDPGRVHEELGYFRVRYESGRQPVATLKIPRGWKGPVREMLEIERPLKELGPGLYPWPRRHVRVDSDLPEEMSRHFLELGIRRLRRLGWMRNFRCLVEVEGLGLLELDVTELPGGKIHHEVEIECWEESLLHRLIAWVEATAPSAEVTRVGKFSRFLDAVAGTPPAPSGG